MTGEHPVLIIAGPTGAGKSAVASLIAGAFGGVIINGDSMQVYRELRVLTARPSLEEEARLPHRLYGVLPAAERCSAGRWLGLATPEIERAWSDRRLPIVVGGTGFYLKALTEGLTSLPAVPDEVRAEVQALYDRIGAERFRTALAAVDPDSAARLAPADRQRLTRAMEVVRATGRPLSAWHHQRPPRPLVRARFATVVMMPPRTPLYAAIEARLARMVAAGAFDEVQALMDLGLDPRLPAMKAVGVRELAACLAGTATREEAIAAAQQATRHLAKRQITWLRHQMRTDLVVTAQDSESFLPELFAFVRGFLLTAGTGATRFLA